MESILSQTTRVWKAATLAASGLPLVLAVFLSW